jgi:thiol-disulfide isomerase/thioredoxin
MTRRVGPFSLRQLAAVAAATLAVAAGLAILTAPLANTGQGAVNQPGSGFYVVGDAQENLVIGAPAPELEGELGGVAVKLYDLDGNLIRLADLRGKVVWLNFWATWCPPCQAETPILRDVYNAHHDDGLALVAVSVQETSPDDVRAYADRYSLGYTIGFDGSAAVFHAYHGFGLPTQIFIDRSGVIRQIVLGPVTRDGAEQILAPLLDK